MKLIEKLLSVNEYSRPGTTLKVVLGIVLHWTASPKQTALAVWHFFEKDCRLMKHYSSAHYIIDQDGTVYSIIPLNERSIHAGSSQLDPVSGEIYTNKARYLFGQFASNPMTLSPNQCTIGIEMCPIDAKGTFSEATLEAASELVQDLMKKYTLSKERIVTHHDVVGWKDCPKLWTDHPEKFKEFLDTLVEEA